MLKSRHVSGSIEKVMSLPSFFFSATNFWILVLYHRKFVCFIYQYVLICTRYTTTIFLHSCFPPDPGKDEGSLEEEVVECFVKTHPELLACKNCFTPSSASIFTFPFVLFIVISLNTTGTIFKIIKIATTFCCCLIDSP